MRGEVRGQVLDNKLRGDHRTHGARRGNRERVPVEGREKCADGKIVMIRTGATDVIVKLADRAPRSKL